LDPSLSWKNKTQSGSLWGKRTNHVPKPQLVAERISTREMDGKLKRVVNLKEPSLATTTHFKIKAI
jgi:hypothetical protein